MNRRTLARSLRALTADPVGRALLADADAAALASLAAKLAADDPYDERAHLDAALALVGRPGRPEPCWATRSGAHTARRRGGSAGSIRRRWLRHSWSTASAGSGDGWIRDRARLADDRRTLRCVLGDRGSDPPVRSQAPSFRLGDGLEPGDIGIAEIDARRPVMAVPRCGRSSTRWRRAECFAHTPTSCTRAAKPRGSNCSVGRTRSRRPSSAWPLARRRCCCPVC